MFVRGVLAGKGDVLICIFVAVMICAFGAFPYLYNYKAYLHIEDRKISGRFGFFKRLECEIKDVEFVLVQFDTVHILLKDRKYFIRGVKNAYDIGAFIMPKIPFCFDGDKKEIIAELKKREKSLKRNTVLTFCAIGMSFVWVVAAVILTGGKEQLSEFNHTDWIIFSIMCVLEVLTVILMFTFAIRSRQANPVDLQKQIYKVCRNTVETTPLLKPEWKVKAVFTDPYFSHRITLYEGCIENNNDSFCYCAEMFDEKFNLKFMYQSEFFESSADVPDVLDKLMDITATFK